MVSSGNFAVLMIHIPVANKVMLGFMIFYSNCCLHIHRHAYMLKNNGLCLQRYAIQLAKLKAHRGIVLTKHTASIRKCIVSRIISLFTAV